MSGTDRGFSTRDLVEEIRAYESVHPELLKSHHFVFDCPLDSAWQGRPSFLWLGVNPGSDEQDWKQRPTRTEETREFDFQSEFGRSTASKSRMTRLRNFLGEDRFRRCTHSELFFWCSTDTEEAFRKRYKYSFEENPHWDFCTRMNRELFMRIRPKAVLAESLKRLRLYERRLELTRVHAHPAGETRIEELRFGDGTPFYCFDHLSAPVRDERRRAVRKTVRGLLAALELKEPG